MANNNRLKKEKNNKEKFNTANLQNGITKKRSYTVLHGIDPFTQEQKRITKSGLL